jgi:hypothetical protein
MVKALGKRQPVCASVIKIKSQAGIRFSLEQNHRSKEDTMSIEMGQLHF